MSKKDRAAFRIVTIVGVAALVASLADAAHAAHFSAWGPPQKLDEVAGNSAELNTPYLDGCLIQSPDGLRFYLASNRPRFVGDTRTDLDIWVAHRHSPDAPWGAPENLGAPVNSTADDFCPTPVRGRGLFFVSRRAIPASCGGADLYSHAATRRAAGASRRTSRARLPEAPTAPPTRWAPPTSKPTARRSCTSPAAPTSTSASSSQTAASARRRR